MKTTLIAALFPAAEPGMNLPTTKMRLITKASLKFAPLLILLLGNPLAPLQASESLSVLASFSLNPSSAAPTPQGLIQGADGNLYGTTDQGGVNGLGSIFEYNLTNKTLTTLYSFSGPDGSRPNEGLVQDSHGNFWGLTFSGGTSDAGTIFKFTPQGTLTTLVAFNGTSTGANPAVGLVLANDGNFYGTTEFGGTADDGTFFKVTTAGALTVISSFADDNAYPVSLIQGQDNNFYGTSLSGGATGLGTIFMITLVGVHDSLTTLPSDLDGPPSSLIQADSGIFYGTTEYGDFLQGMPSIFAGGASSFATLSPLGADGIDDGSFPYAGVFQASDGNLYGTTSTNGTDSLGAFFKQIPPTATSRGSFSFLNTARSGTDASFTGTNGSAPYGHGVIQDDTGLPVFYGTTTGGGANGAGVLYKLTLNKDETQTITFPAITNPAFINSPPFQVSATSSSGLPVTFTISSGPATVDGNGLVTVTGSGTVLIAANQAGDLTTAVARSVVQAFTVSKLSQAINFTLADTFLTTDTANLNASASSGLPVTYKVTGPGVITSGVLSFTKAGSVTVTASQAGDGTTYAAATPVTQSVTVSLTPQTISSFPTIRDQVATATVTLTAAASSTLPVTYAVTGPAKVSGGVLSFTGAGAVSVTANQVGNALYAPVSLSRSFNVTLATQKITFPTIAAQTSPATVTLAATASSSLPVTYTITVTAGATKTVLHGSDLTVNGAGTVQVEADQPGNNLYAAASSATRSFAVH